MLTTKPCKKVNVFHIFDNRQLGNEKRDGYVSESYVKPSFMISYWNPLRKYSEKFISESCLFAVVKSSGSWAPLSHTVGTFNYFVSPSRRFPFLKIFTLWPACEGVKPCKRHRFFCVCPSVVDPYVFGPPGSRSGSVIISTDPVPENLEKPWFPLFFVTSFWLFIFEDWRKYTFKK